MNTLWTSVTKLSQLVAIVLGLSIFALGYYLGQESNKVVESEIEGNLYNAQIGELENQYVEKITNLKENGGTQADPAAAAVHADENTASIAVSSADGETKQSVTLTGGYETNPVDNGRPAVLIAAGLGVTEEVFRDAFSNVTPAQGGHPSEEATAANKKILMDTLGPYGITNDELDTVSNYYRYSPESEEVWQIEKAELTATVVNGTVTDVQIVNGGSGYLSEPTISIEGIGELSADVTLHFSEDLTVNGSIESITLK